ncbi:hypothetical protein Goe5_c01500 [Bacillus phage vB_BthM-Goe5]|nr:hypothetical protein Goe5_c01500 [Bacillus phage vB_BthM-Goe5]
MFTLYTFTYGALCKHDFDDAKSALTFMVAGVDAGDFTPASLWERTPEGSRVVFNRKELRDIYIKS